MPDQPVWDAVTEIIKGWNVDEDTAIIISLDFAKTLSTVSTIFLYPSEDSVV